MNFLKKITTKSLWIYIGVVFIFNLILNHILWDFFVNTLEAFYMILPAVLQKLLHTVPPSLAQLNPTTIELSVLFAVDTVEKIGKFIEFSIVGAVLWLIFYKRINKILTKNS